MKHQKQVDAEGGINVPEEQLKGIGLNNQSIRNIRALVDGRAGRQVPVGEKKYGFLFVISDL